MPGSATPRASLLLVFCLALAPAPAAPTAEKLPATEDIRKLFEAGNYREALQKLSKVINLKGDAAAVYDKHELWRMKAESHLKLKDTNAAANAFAQAAKQATDEKEAAFDHASELVVKRSKNLSFTPKPTKAGEKAVPIDISDPEKRKAAFAALLAEAKAAAEPKIKAAKGARQLPPLVDALREIGDLRTLELAATGEDARSKDLVGELSGRANDLMADGVKDMVSLVLDIEQSANDVVQSFAPIRQPGMRSPIMSGTLHRRGLSNKDVQELRQVVSDCQQLVPMARELAQMLGDEGKDFDKIALDGEAVGNKANELLKADYANDLGRPPHNIGIRRPIERR